MEGLVLTSKFKALLIGGVGLLLAIFLGSQIGASDYQPIIFGVLIAIACVLWFSGPYFWLLAIASSFLAGTFPILREHFTPFHILMAMGLAKFVIGDVILQRIPLKKPSNFDLLMIAGFMSVLTVHGVQNRFGMRFLGSSTWGGHNYVNVYVGMAAFFVTQSIPMNPKVWAKLPLVILAVTAFDLLIAVITTILPASIYVIYPFYSAVSVVGLGEIISGGRDVTGRVGAFGTFGVILVTLILATAPVQRLLHPSNFFRLLALIGGALSALYSGFRSAVFGTLVTVLAAGVRDLKGRVLFLLPLIAGILFTLSVINSELVPLPKQVQRGLAFIPGNWDVTMAQDAAASNVFRRNVWELWYHQYFPAQPWFGRGFGFKSEWTKPSIYYLKGIDYQQMVEVGNIHNGFLAALDAIGIIGTIFFVIWTVRLLARTFRVSFRGNDEAGIALRFLALYLAVWIITYWVGALNVGSFLPQTFAFAGVFLRLQGNISAESKGVTLGAGTRDQNIREEVTQVG